MGGQDTTFIGADLGSFRIGVDDSNDFHGLIQDADGTTVAEWTDSTFLTLARIYHIQVSWDAILGTVAAAVNGTLIDPGDYSTTPSGSWVPASPLNAKLNYGSHAGAWSGQIHLVQISSQYLL